MCITDFYRFISAHLDEEENFHLTNEDKTTLHTMLQGIKDVALLSWYEWGCRVTVTDGVDYPYSVPNIIFSFVEDELERRGYTIPMDGGKPFKNVGPWLIVRNTNTQRASEF